MMHSQGLRCRRECNVIARRMVSIWRCDGTQKSGDFPYFWVYSSAVLTCMYSMVRVGGYVVPNAVVRRANWRWVRLRIACLLLLVFVAFSIGSNVRSVKGSIPWARIARGTILHRRSPLLKSGRDRLTEALEIWQPTAGGTIPPTVIDAAARCHPADVAAVALLAYERPNIVIDVGANGGYPVTEAAVQGDARLVLAVEPDKRNIPRLRKQRRRSKVSKFVIMHGAAGATSASMRMMFSKKRNDYTCFTCMDERRSDVFIKTVRVRTVDGILKKLDFGGPVSFMKTDAQGFELQVLKGAKETFEEGRVEMLMVEFDPKLLRTRENTLELLRLIVDYRMQCVHLAFSGRRRANTSVPQFDDLPIHKDNAEAFLDFVVQNTGWTDLLCFKLANA